jgi:hypothetical protein
MRSYADYANYSMHHEVVPRFFLHFSQDFIAKGLMKNDKLKKIFLRLPQMFSGIRRFFLHVSMEAMQMKSG